MGKVMETPKYVIVFAYSTEVLQDRVNKLLEEVSYDPVGSIIIYDNPKEGLEYIQVLIR